MLQSHFISYCKYTLFLCLYHIYELWKRDAVLISSWRRRRQNSLLLYTVRIPPTATPSQSVYTAETASCNACPCLPSSPTVCTEGIACNKLRKQENHFKKIQNSRCFQSFTFLILLGQFNISQVWLFHFAAILPPLLKKKKKRNYISSSQIACFEVTTK
jgi:hypothetical protein